MVCVRHDNLELRGTYIYSSMHELDAALAQARALIVDDELADLDAAWLDTFVRRGSSLRVHASVPFTADQYLTTAVLQALARHAIDGVVEASQCGRCVDWFPSGRDD
jgi:hypothetical protein